jgi:hypothetical protein
LRHAATAASSRQNESDRSLALDADETVHALQLGPERRGDVEIGLLMTVGRPYLEDDSDHGSLLLGRR